MAVADPSVPPGQETKVVVPVNVAGVFPTITFAEEGQPPKDYALIPLKTFKKFINE